MKTAALIGWVALVVNVTANELLGKKKRSGWPMRLVANAVWIIYSALVFSWPLLANHVVFAVSNTRAWIQWRREDKR